ncbi:hypothetical protein RJT34_18841 [Clitoria ternatea]|uniref:HR-like lesion-inducer n=1 Tax=Clitoria ternatea TaxID=43366 RepID=A0AAN9P2S5_CLITE
MGTDKERLLTGFQRGMSFIPEKRSGRYKEKPEHLCSLSTIQMAFASFLGRVLFASVFILSAYQEFSEYGVDGGPAAKVLRPKFDAFIHRVHSQAGIQLPEIDVKVLVAGAIALKGIGGILFICGSYFGAILLLLHQMIATPILYDFYNYDSDDKELIQLFIKFTQNMALSGALLFFIGMKNSIPRRQPKKKVLKTKTY